MAILDDLSGYDFEDLMEDVFRKLGYENVRQSGRTADEGRDILMEEVVDGTRRAVVVECKHTATVSRPVVQKLHSAVATYEYDGPRRGMVVTTGRFTEPAREYARKVGHGGEHATDAESEAGTRTRSGAGIEPEDETNREAFRAEYDQMAIHEKAMENVPLAVGSVLAALFVLLAIASSIGVF